jgi:5-hydroxyisourate hydrolase
MSGISTHVLNTAAGKPAPNVPVQLFREDQLVARGLTNEDGRWSDARSDAGVYRIVFDIAALFPNSFYPSIEISFRISDASGHYHVPLLLSPFGYTTYRGS